MLLPSVVSEVPLNELDTVPSAVTVCVWDTSIVTLYILGYVPFPSKLRIYLDVAFPSLKSNAFAMNPPSVPPKDPVACSLIPPVVTACPEKIEFTVPLGVKLCV